MSAVARMMVPKRLHSTPLRRVPSADRRRARYSRRGSRLTALTAAPTTGAAVVNLAFAWQADGRLAGANDILGNRTPTPPAAALIKANPAAGANQLIQTASSTNVVQRTLTYKTGGDLAQDVHVGASTTTYGYIYNAAKRLTTVSQNGAAVGNYAYDFAGRRVWRRTYGLGAAQTAYVYDEGGHLLAEHNATTGAATREYVWIDDMPIALADIAGATTTVAYITTGQIDEPLAVTNAAKALIWNGYVDAFGNASTFTTPTTPLDMRLPGQSFQLETNNLSQNGYRDYDPSLGRYAETDPLGINAGQNLYAYVDGDPVNGRDLEGLIAIPAPPPGIAIPAAAGTVGVVVGGGLLLGSDSVQQGTPFANCPPDPDCPRILRDIDAATTQVTNRYDAMANDEWSLFTRAFTTPIAGQERKGTWKGHGDQLDGWRRRLQKLISEADTKRCPVPLRSRWVAYMTPTPLNPAGQ